MRRRPDPLMAVLFSRRPTPGPGVAWEVEPVGAVEPWSIPPPATLPETQSDEEKWHAVQRRRPWVLLWRVLFGLLILWAVGWFVCTKLARPTRSQMKAASVAQAGRPHPFQAVHAPDKAVLATISWERVHAELFPAWIVALQKRSATTGRKEADAAFAALRAEAGKDPNLQDLLDQLEEKVRDVAAFGADIRTLLKGWNQYLAANHIAWRVEYRFEKTAAGTRLLAHTYRVLADVPVAVGQENERVLVVARGDRSRLIEPFFGQTSSDRDGAILVWDRVADYAIDRVWLMVGLGEDTAQPPAETSLRQAVRAEAARSLPAETLAAIEQSAPVRKELLAVLAELKTRGGCGATVVVVPAAWNGLSETGQQMVRSVAEGNERRQCTKLTFADADRLIDLSRRLDRTPGLEASIARLASWVARAVAVHEARHLADDRRAGQWDRTPRCKTCPASMTPNERAEVSAYLASFSTEGLGNIALLQACGVDTWQHGANAAALSFVVPKLLPGGCQGEIPEDLHKRAQALDEELFDRREAVTVPSQFPDSLPIGRH